MANRREEERERLREARESQEKNHTSSERKRLLLGYGAAAVIGLIVIAGVVALIVNSGGDDEGGGQNAHINQQSGSTNGVAPDDRVGTKVTVADDLNLKAAAKAAGCELRLGLPNEGKEHLDPGSEEPEYKTNPPTSGNHVNPPFQQADGAYSEMPLPIDMVHSMEHGRLEIQYSPDLPEAAQLELKGLYDTMYGGSLLFPNDEMPYEVAATTWTNLMGCDKYEGQKTLDAIAAFGRQTWGRFGGEAAGAFTIVGPTPEEPAS